MSVGRGAISFRLYAIDTTVPLSAEGCIMNDAKAKKEYCRLCRYHGKPVCSECVGKRYFEPKNGVVAKWS